MNKNRNKGVHYLLVAGLSFSLALGVGATCVHAEAEETVVETEGNQGKKNESKFASVTNKKGIITIAGGDGAELRPEDLFRAYGKKDDMGKYDP